MRRLISLFRRDRTERELDRELEFHFEQMVEENVAAGMTTEEARRAARLAFGGTDQIKEACRDEHAGEWVRGWVREIGFALRSLFRAPVVSLVVVVTYALCLGPSTALFSTFYALVLKPLPYLNAERLVVAHNTYQKLGRAPAEQGGSYLQFRDFSTQADQFVDFAAAQELSFTLGDAGAPERLSGLKISAGFPSLLGVKPLLGRFADPSEQATGRDHVLVLTEDYWRARFAADAAVLGKKVRIDSEPWTIVGVAPREMSAINHRIKFFVPFVPSSRDLEARARFMARCLVVGRLAERATLESAEQQLDTIDKASGEKQVSPASLADLKRMGHHITLSPLQNVRPGFVFLKALHLLLAGGVLVVLIAAVNITTLLVTRANMGRPAFATRHALGADRAALAKPFWVESLVLALVGAGGAGLIAFGVLAVVNVYLPKLNSGVPHLSLEAPTWLGLVAVAIAIGGLAGMVCAELVCRSDLRMHASQNLSASRLMRRTSRGLIPAQIALSLILCLSAGLLLRSYAHVIALDPGFDVDQVLQGRIAIPKGYEDATKNIQLQDRVLDALSEIPGVDSVAVASDGVSPVVIHGSEVAPGANLPIVFVNLVSPDYFSTMGLRFLAGNGFDKSSDANAVVVDEVFVKILLAGTEPMGREVAIDASAPGPGKSWGHIVGVVRKARIYGLGAEYEPPSVYVPVRLGGQKSATGGFGIVLRSNRDAGELIKEARQKLQGIDPNMPLYSAGSLREQLDNFLIERRGILFIAEVFGALASILAAIGLFGILWYEVAQRERELGIRSALGASPGQMRLGIMRQAVVPVMLGLGLGGLGAAFLTRFLRAQLYQVGPWDLVTFLSVSLGLIAVAFLATFIPAHRASQVNPVDVLRAE